MANDKPNRAGKALHQLMEEDFQQLVDIIEQKKMLHEDIDLTEKPGIDPIQKVAARLHEQCEELGAETLAEFLYALEGSARSGDLEKTTRLLKDIAGEFESVKNILDQD